MAHLDNSLLHLHASRMWKAVTRNFSKEALRRESPLLIVGDGLCGSFWDCWALSSFVLLASTAAAAATTHCCRCLYTSEDMLIRRHRELFSTPPNISNFCSYSSVFLPIFTVTSSSLSVLSYYKHKLQRCDSISSWPSILIAPPQHCLKSNDASLLRILPIRSSTDFPVELDRRGSLLFCFYLLTPSKQLATNPITFRFLWLECYYYYWCCYFVMIVLLLRAAGECIHS